MRIRPSLALAIALVALAGCAPDSSPSAPQDVNATDPLLARALNDPLMVDPDLAYRNEANAAVTIRHDRALPALIVTEEMAGQAREAARAELLRDGSIPALPFAAGTTAPASIGELTNAADIIRTLGGPSDCARTMGGGLVWAAEMPGPSAIMPHGMVQQAAGAQGGVCSVRVVRYLTPVTIDDALGYHFAKADRARLRPEVFESPERGVIGENRDEYLAAFARNGPGQMTSVDLVYWRK